MDALAWLEKKQFRTDLPDFKVGDRVRVHVNIVEGDRRRIQVFEGIVIRLRRGGIRSSFTVRKVSYGVGVERIFPLHSPIIEKIEVMASSHVRRAKLYFLRSRRGKAARLREKRTPVSKRSKR